MSRRSRATAASAAPAKSFDALETGRLTWLGLTLAAIGWAGLIAEATVGDVIATKLPHPLSSSLHVDLIDIAKCIIASGFALAIIGALQTGFGALNRFFEAVLMRSSQRNAPVERASETPPDMGPVSSRPNYRILSDGSVEVETIVGTRRFETLAEARDFI